jgi:hypothetical protein
MFSSRPSIGKELLDVPMGEMIRDMAFSIAEAQVKLDSNSIEVAQMMGGLKTIHDEVDGKVTFEDSRVFFGKEKITLGQALAALNNSTDINYNSEIKKAAGANITETTAPVEAKPAVGNTPAIEAKPGVYTLLSTAKPETAITVPARLSMMELGFTPTFYQFVDTIIEVKISIKYTEEASSSVEISTNTKQKAVSRGLIGMGQRGRAVAERSRTVTTTQVNASYSQKYSYSAEGSSLLRTKLVPVPPPAILEERIRQQMEVAKESKPTP